MKPVCIVSCPIDTFSGYGHRSRDFVNSLIKIKDNDDVSIGKKIVKIAIQEPFNKILTNAGHDNNDISFNSFKLMSKRNTWSGLNYKNLKVIDFKEEGIIDPKKVTRIALENAASIAGTILTTESIVYEKRKEKEEEVPNPMAGMM